MRRVAPIPVLALSVLFACSDTAPPTKPAPSSGPTASPAISDGTHLDGNPHFFWLPPMVEQPDESLLGSFNGDLRPLVRVVCLASDDPDVATCDPSQPVTHPSSGATAEFTVGDGVVVEDDHYRVDFDTDAFGLHASSSDGPTTTYRIEVLTPGLGGVRAVFGIADFQVGENGKDARNLSDEGATIGLKDGRTLPIRFRLDEGAAEFALEEQTANEDQALCQINCSVTVIEPDEPTEASLEDPDDSEFDLTAIRFEAGDVDETSVLLIDQRATDGGDAECAPGIGLEKEACFRYEIFPDEEFNNGVRVGICPVGVPQTDAWRILKADDGELTRPPGAFVDDFLDCSISGQPTALWQGVGGELAGRVAGWFVSPLWARDRWGSTIFDLSDLFWGRDVEMSAVTDVDTATAGDTLLTTLRVSAVHPDPDSAIAGAEVTFTVTGGAASTLTVPAGATTVGTPTSTEVSLLTDASGEATIGWILDDGDNQLTVTSPVAVASGGGPLTFEVTGVPRVAFADVATASGHSCGLTTGGKIYCWGHNADGQLGDGTTTSSTTPVQVASNETFVSVDAGGRSTCALADDGTLYCWGNNDLGQLGDGSTSSSSDPVSVTGGPAAFSSVDIGWRHACGVGANGTTYCWGHDGDGRLGDGAGAPNVCQNSLPCSVSPRPVSSNVAFTSISAGLLHSCGLDGSGAAYCWGQDQGSFGHGIPFSDSPIPVAAFDGLNLSGISAGAAYTCGREATGDASCSGLNLSGQLGDGTTDPDSLPSSVTGGLTFDQVEANEGNSIFIHTCGVTDTGAGYCWGNNDSGELGAASAETCTSGNLTVACSTEPVAVSGGLSFRVLDPGGGTFTGGGHTCGLTTGGRIFCWGRNDGGQLGDGTTTDRSAPVEVTLP